MLFNSVEFWIFFLIFITIWRFVKFKEYLRWVTLVIFSFFFYAWWDWRFVFLIIFSGLVDFYCGFYISKSINKISRKVFLLVSIILNMLALIIFKYADFLLKIFHDVLSFTGIPQYASYLPSQYHMILPLGISFFTFQSMSYTIDIYRGKLKPTENIVHFFSYLVMFPQLVAGPIIRAKDFLHQLKSYRRVTDIEKWHAFKMICFGLFRKVVIADNLAFLVDSAYEGKAHFEGPIFWWMVTVSFSIQIYCDFSGYSLIARGLAKLLGYRFRINFNHPYLSNRFKDFWGNWHISLSTWFRDYVYIPMGGARQGKITWVIALFTTFFLSGLWHGANYTFLIWGGVHFMFLFLEKVFPIKFNKVIRYFVVLIGINISWIFFRSSSLNQSLEVLQNMVAFREENFQFLKLYFNSILFLVLAILIEISVWIRRKNSQVNSFLNNYHFDVFELIFVVTSILLFRGEGKQFIYFQF